MWSDTSHAAYRIAWRTSSASSSGYASSTSSTDRPPASIRRMTLTVILVPRMVGCPRHTRGSLTIRSSRAGRVWSSTTVPPLCSAHRPASREPSIPSTHRECTRSCTLTVAEASGAPWRTRGNCTPHEYLALDSPGHRREFRSLDHVDFPARDAFHIDPEFPLIEEDTPWTCLTPRERANDPTVACVVASGHLERFIPSRVKVNHNQPVIGSCQF